MKIKIKNKVVDLALVEEMNMDDMGFSITLNNGRLLEFYPEPISMTPLLKGTMQELNTFMLDKRDRSMAANNEDLKELYYTDNGSRESGKLILNLFDKKEKDKKQLENYEKLASTYKWCNQQYKEYIKDNVKYEESN